MKAAAKRFFPLPAAVLAAALIFLAGCVASEEDFLADNPPPPGFGQNIINVGSSGSPSNLGTVPVSTTSSVASSGTSYYRVDLALGTYTFTISGMSEDADLFVYDDAAFSNEIGFSDNFNTATDQVTNISCQLIICTRYIRVLHFSGTLGTTFTLAVQQSATTSEGSFASALAIGTAPFTRISRVGPGGTSYYSISTGTGNFTMTILGMTEDADLFAYDTPAFGLDIGSSSNPGTTTERTNINCTNTTCTGGVQVRHISGSAGTLFVYSLQSRPFTSEGSFGTPLAIGTAPFMHTGRVAAGGISYYSITVGNGSFTITLSGMTENADLFGFNNPQFQTEINNSTNTGTSAESVNISCSSATCDGGVQVRHISGTAGTVFNLTVQ